MSFTDPEDEEEFEDDDDAGETKPPVKPQPPAQPPLNSSEIADSVIRRLREETGQSQDRDDILDAVNTLRKEGYSDAAITLHLISTTALEKKLTKKFQQELREQSGQAVVKLRDQGAIDAFDKTFGDIKKAVPKLAKTEDSIRGEVIKRYFADEARKAAWQRGEVSKSVISDLVDEVSDEYIKEFGLVKENGRQPAAAGAAGKSSKSGGAEKQQENNNIPYKDRLEHDHQRAAFNTAKCNNMKLLGMKPEEAEKSAYEFARKIPKPKTEARVT